MTLSFRPHRVALIDRPWLDHYTVALATPLAVRPYHQVRAVLADFMRGTPSAPLACRLDTRSNRWLPVPAAERAAHLDRVLVATDDPDPGDLSGHILNHRKTVPDLPLLIAVSPGSIMIQVCHAVGDAVTLAQLMFALTRGDLRELDRLARPVRTGVPARALMGGMRAHHREWARCLRHRSGPPVPEPVGPATTPRPSFTSATLGNAALRDITRWRNTNARGVSLTCVLTAAMHNALTRDGVPMDDRGFYALIDMRTALPERPEPYWGNMSKSLYLSADPTDPRSVESALRTARKTHRVVPATLIGAVTSAVTRHRPPTALRHPAVPVTLTFNSIPTLPRLADLPWRDQEDQRFYAFGPSLGPGGISVSALRLRSHMELTASFDEATVKPETMRRALESLSDVTGPHTG